MGEAAETEGITERGVGKGTIQECGIRGDGEGGWPSWYLMEHLDRVSTHIWSADAASFPLRN